MATSASPLVADKGKGMAIQPAYSNMDMGMESMQSMQSMQQNPYSFMSNAFAPSMGMGFMETQQQNMMTSNQMAEPVFDAAAFERAFDAATAEIELQHQVDSQAEVEALMTGAATTDWHSSGMATFEINKSNLDQSMVYPEQALEKEADADKIEEADALAATAGQLLDSVSHDTSDKFAQSSFLALMRRLRDGEVKVDGENLIEVCLPRSQCGC
jgi:hypothetical protein